ncbi:hypothetical protein CEE45_06215 [Candidatus Heimdallarchaeota archaeon B3_Heim]|nr:MAG: hypothetical protein CEE45_06215 [Candidatus Heimdallarchaeota archaeon B3_Heim]
MLKFLYSSQKRILITASFLLISSLIFSMIFIQAWFDYEVKRQLNATETNINSIEILDYSVKGANITVNASVSNPHNIEITTAETNFSILYGTTKMGFVCIPKIILEKKIESMVFNSTFYLVGVNWVTYFLFGTDLVYDGEISVNITGKLKLSAPALFYTVYSTIEINSRITLTTDIISFMRVI